MVRRARKNVVSKQSQMIEAFKVDPDLDIKAVAKKYRCHLTAVYSARKKARGPVESNGLGSDLTATNSDLSATNSDLSATTKDIRTIKRMGVSRAKQVITLIESIMEN